MKKSGIDLGAAQQDLENATSHLKAMQTAFGKAKTALDTAEERHAKARKRIVDEFEAVRNGTSVSKFGS